MIDFICMCFVCLVLDLYIFFREIVGKNYINVMEGGVIRLSIILEFFNKGGRISSIEF